MPTNVEILKLARAWDAARAHRLAEQKKVDELAAQERALKQRLMEAIKQTKAKSVGSKEYIYAVTKKDEPTVENWPKFYDYIKKTSSFDLLYRRLNPAAVKERWEDGVKVPGIVKFPVEDISRTKAKGA